MDDSDEQLIRPFRRALKSRVPDFYAQEQHQKEDVLQPQTLRMGYKYEGLFPQDEGEHESARARLERTENSSKIFTMDRLVDLMNDVMAERARINFYSDTSKRRIPITKDNYQFVVAPKINQVRQWFSDLARGTVPLSRLSRSIPLFNKKDDVLNILSEQDIPSAKAIWYLKLWYLYQMQFNEMRMKKKHNIDPSSDCTANCCEFLDVQLKALDTILNNESEAISVPAGSGTAGGGTTGSSTTGSSTAGSGTAAGDNRSAETKTALSRHLKHWYYMTRLVFVLAQERLLNRNDWCNWLLKQIECDRFSHLLITKLIIFEVIKFEDIFAKSALFARRVAVYCCAKLRLLISETACKHWKQFLLPLASSSEPKSAELTVEFLTSRALYHLSECPDHRPVVLCLTSLLHIILFKCPQALVWTNSSLQDTVLGGSPIDLLYCLPSQLPLPRMCNAESSSLHKRIVDAEMHVLERSVLAELHWTRFTDDSLLRTVQGEREKLKTRTLNLLDVHDFSMNTDESSLDSLEQNIFSFRIHGQRLDTGVTSSLGPNCFIDASFELVGLSERESLEIVIGTLFEWACSKDRFGLHRPLIASHLVRRFVQQYFDGVTPDWMQAFIVDFLETRLCPLLDEQADQDTVVPTWFDFGSLLLLLNCLMECQLFNLARYFCSMIARGFLEKPLHVVEPELLIDDALVSSFERLRSLPPRYLVLLCTPLPNYLVLSPPSWAAASSNAVNWNDVANQRAVLLYGVGKRRSAVEKLLKRIEKDIHRYILDSRFMINVKTGTTIHKASKKSTKKTEDGHAGLRLLIRNKLRRLVPYDLCAIVDRLAADIVNYLTDVSTTPAPKKKSSTSTKREIAPSAKPTPELPADEEIPVENYRNLPDLQMLQTVCQLFLESCNVCGFLAFADRMFSVLPGIEQFLCDVASPLSGFYSYELASLLTAVLSRLHPCVVALPALCCSLAYNIAELLSGHRAESCPSSARHLFAYLHELNKTSGAIGRRYINHSSLQEKIADADSSVFQQVPISSASLAWNRQHCEVLKSSQVEEPPNAATIEWLRASAANRYSLVCSCVAAVMSSRSSTDVTNVAVYAARCTSLCNALAGDWIGAVKTMLTGDSSAEGHIGYIDILTTFDRADESLRDRITLFIAILISRHCIVLESLIKQVIMKHSFSGAYRAASDPLNSAKSGDMVSALNAAHLALHLIRRLFVARHLCFVPDVSPLLAAGQGQSREGLTELSQHILTNFIQLESASLEAVTASVDDAVDNGSSLSQKDKFQLIHLIDRCNLIYIQQSLSDGALLAVLKFILLLSFQNQKGRAEPPAGAVQVRSADVMMNAELCIGGLVSHARTALLEVCGQLWVREKLLHNHHRLVTNEEYVIDRMFSGEQQMVLLHLICDLSSFDD